MEQTLSPSRSQGLSQPGQGLENFFADLAKRPALMGILNVTPDSFSDGGHFITAQKALSRAQEMVEEGAAVIDIGAESTRPGYAPISHEEEWERLEGILPILLREICLPISIDTYKPRTANRALALGVKIVNDVWGLQYDADMASVVADYDAGLAIMHNREQIDPGCDIVSDIKNFFDRSLNIAARKNIDLRKIMLDPGIGFGKTKDQNLAALSATHEFSRIGPPVLIGVSRKSLLGLLLGAQVDNRLIGTLAANIACVARGARILRVHDIAAHLAALKVWTAVQDAHG